MVLFQTLWSMTLCVNLLSLWYKYLGNICMLHSYQIKLPHPSFIYTIHMTYLLLRKRKKTLLAKSSLPLHSPISQPNSTLPQTSQSPQHPPLFPQTLSSPIYPRYPAFQLHPQYIQHSTTLVPPTPPPTTTTLLTLSHIPTALPTCEEAEAGEKPVYTCAVYLLFFWGGGGM